MAASERPWEARPGVKVLSERPRLYAVDGFLGKEEIARLLQDTSDPGRLAALGIQPKHDRTGASFELPLGASDAARALHERIEAVTGVRNALPWSLRFRRYSPGEHHPRHVDSYVISGRTLILTAMAILVAPQAGGETLFPDALPEPVAVRPRAGRLVFWFGHRPDGSLDPESLHEGLPVHAGEKVTLTSFVYADPAASATVPPALCRS